MWTYPSYSDIERTGFATGGIRCSRNLLQTDFRVLVVVVQIAEPEGPSVITGERDFICVRIPYRRFVREGEPRIGGDHTDGRRFPKDFTLEIRVKGLEERRRGIRRIEKLGKRGVAERPERS